MIALALIAVAATQPAQARAVPVAQATASVRIVAGKRMTLGKSTPEAELRRTRFRDTDGLVKPARLIEFQ